MDTEDITKLLTLVATEWSKSECKEAVEAAVLLEEVLNTPPVDESWDDTEGLRCFPPDLSGVDVGQDEGGVGRIVEIIRKVNNQLSWKTPKHLLSSKLRSGFSTTTSLSEVLGGEDKFKSAMIVGSDTYGAQYLSDKLLVGLTWLAPGTRYPPHAHHAQEVYHVLIGSASWGPTQDILEQKKPGAYIFHPSAMPHTIHVPEDDLLLAIYAWTGHIGGKFWFGDLESGERFAGDINSVGDPMEYYDDMAGNYEEVVRGWGYNMPEIVADKIKDFIEDTENTKILDLGCGYGLVGEALVSRGFSDITGMDISEKMLAIAAAKEVYKTVDQVDLLKTLPAESSSFDILSCVGTSTYLLPHVMGEWLRVVTTGGLLVFTHKTGVVGMWQEEQQKMEEEGRWRCRYKSEPLYYLPGLVDPGMERVYVFVYQKV